jgi:hypothetical protein
MIYGYARVSTAAQDESGQVKQLKTAGCRRIFREKLTGATADQPQLGKLMKTLAPGDVVITPAVDRLSRDTTDLLASFEKRVGGNGRSSPSSPSNARWSGCRGAGPCQALAAEGGGRKARLYKG